MASHTSGRPHDTHHQAESEHRGGGNTHARTPTLIMAYLVLAVLVDDAVDRILAKFFPVKARVVIAPRPD